MPEFKKVQKQQNLPLKKKVVPEMEVEEEYEEEEEIITKPKPLVKKKLPVAQMIEEVDPDEEEPEDVEEVEEEPAVAKKKPLKKIMEKPKSALAKAFAAVPLSNNATGIKAGTYEGIIRSIVLQEPDSKGQSVRINAELCGEEFEDANQLVDWRKLISGDGEAVTGGIRALGNDLARLGYEFPDTGGDFDENLEAIFDAITKERPGVILKVTYQHVNGVDYQHFQVQGECDNDVVRAYKDNVPY
jgi:hypothetical protein